MTQKKVEIKPEELDQKQLQKSNLYIIIELHEFFQIFFRYDDKLSRPQRFSIFYLKINVLIALSGLFSQAMNEVQSILFSIICALFLTIPMNVIEYLLISRRCFLRSLGVFFLVGMTLVSMYASLTVAAIMGKTRSNQWTSSYLISFTTDFYIMTPIKILVKVFILRKAVQLAKKISGFLVKVIGEDILEFFKRKDEGS